MDAHRALSALLIVFAVAAGVIVALFVLAGVLARRNAKGRNRVRRHLANLGDADPRERLGTLTTGDLVMDQKLAEQVEALAHGTEETRKVTSTGEDADIL